MNSNYRGGVVVTTSRIGSYTHEKFTYIFSNMTVTNNSSMIFMVVGKSVVVYMFSTKRVMLWL